MNILGLNCFKHDSAAGLLQDGKVVAAAEEERFLRLKHTHKFPQEAGRYCLREAGLRPGDIDYVAFYMRPQRKFWLHTLHSLRHWPKTTTFFQGQAYDALRMRLLWRYLRRDLRLERKRTRLVYVAHHLAHAAGAFFLSPFEEAGILSLDGAGELPTALLGYGRGNRLGKLHQVYFPYSLGFVYSAVTKYLGFSPNEDEYKIMGLAPYGKPVYADSFSRIIAADKQGGFKVDLSYFEYYLNFEGALVAPKFLKLFGPGRRPEEPALGRYADIAASLQQVLEEVVLQMARRLYELTRSDNLCLAGGVALNCAMNGRLLREGPFKRIFVQPAANDSGTSLGAALYLYHQLLGKPRRYVMADAYLGPAYADEEIEQMLKENRLRFRRCEKIESEVARLLAEGRVVGWFQGRMEFGPRALGNRSILADARRAEMKDLVNERIKHREMFRPFAPSVRIEDAGEYFVGCVESPFMTMVYPVRRDKQGVIPAVTHVDGTARVQTVDKQSNPRYWELLRCFKELTGVGVVLNTSFNVKGEPIVCTPEDALKCFYSTGLEYLAIGTYLVEK